MFWKETLHYLVNGGGDIPMRWNHYGKRYYNPLRTLKFTNPPWIILQEVRAPYGRVSLHLPQIILSKK